MGLFLGTVFWSIDLCVCFLCQFYIVLITTALYHSLKSGNMIPSALFFILKIVETGYSEYFMLPTKFKIFSISEELDPKTRTHPLDQRLWPWTWCFKGPLSKFSRTIPLLRQLSVPEACSWWGTRECCCKLMKVVI